MAENSNLRGRVALITGAASGIGAAGARRLAAAGVSIVVVDTDAPGAELMAKAITSDGGRAVAVAADVTDELSMTQAFDQASDLGGLDIVWNNAGVEAFGPAVMVTIEDYRKLFDVNVLGVLLGTKLALSRLGAGGVILNTASVAGLSGVPMQVLYAASKAAVVSITRTAALEAGERGIRCNCICPAVVRTPLIEKTLGGALTTEMEATLAATTVLGRLIEPAEVAAAAAYLVSDEASFITGQCLTIDGGMTAGPRLQIPGPDRGSADATQVTEDRLANPELGA